LLEHLRVSLLTEGLTDREAQICSYIMSGDNTFAIAAILGIARKIVATHRKKAYAKLGISSHTELFSRYIGAIQNGVHS
jgi:DNA-binding CsgD family transcriptional regulator